MVLDYHSILRILRLKNRNHGVAVHWQTATPPCDLYLCGSDSVIKDSIPWFLNNHLIALYVKMMADIKTSSDRHETSFPLLDDNITIKKILLDWLLSTFTQHSHAEFHFSLFYTMYFYVKLKRNISHFKIGANIKCTSLFLNMTYNCIRNEFLKRCIFLLVVASTSFYCSLVIADIFLF